VERFRPISAFAERPLTGAKPIGAGVKDRIPESLPPLSAAESRADESRRQPDRRRDPHIIVETSAGRQ